MPHEQELPDGTPEEQAAHWLVRRHSGNWGFRDEQALRHWLAADRRNMAAYRHVLSLWQGLDQFKSTSPISTRSKLARSAPTLAAAASVLFLLFAALPSLGPDGQIYRTSKGETASLSLTDGTLVELNSDTELVAELGWFKRHILLRRGEAIFDVSHQRLRPFEVEAGPGRIIDIGTRFDVYRGSSQVEVSVLLGEVRVETQGERPTNLLVGQRLRFDSAGKQLGTDRPDLAAVTAWRQGQLVLDFTTLEDATRQLARYHAVEFVFDEPSLRQLRISGVFNTKDLPLFLKTLEKLYPLHIQGTEAGPIHLTSTKAIEAPGSRPSAH